jgi:hypothetical protein
MTAHQIIKKFEKLKMLKEISGKKRYKPYKKRNRIIMIDN